jgi:hypothetical protein
MIGSLFVFLVTFAMYMFGNFIEIVLSSVRQINVRVFLLSDLPLFLDSWSSGRLFFLFVFFFFFLVARRWLRMPEIEAMLVVSVFYFMVERLRPIMIIVDILAEVLVGDGEGIITSPFNVILVAGDDGVVDKI